MEERVRGYRRGIPYRTGDVKLETFLQEFKFSGVEYNEKYSEDEKRYYLNYTYDALKDLAAILNIPTQVISLERSVKNRPIVYFGKADKGRENLVIDKKGDILKSWVYFLDKFLCKQYGETGSFCTLINSGLDNELAQLTRLTLQTIKLKEVKVERWQVSSLKLQELKDELYDLLESMPFKEGLDFDDIMTIEDSRNKFISNLTEETLKDMVDVFESNNLSLANIKEGLLGLLREAQAEQERLLKEENKDNIVSTDFFKSCENRNKAENTQKYTSNLELLAQAIQAYINKKLKEVSYYNNFLINQNDLEIIPLNVEEEQIVFGAIEKLLSKILDSLEISEDEGFVDSEDLPLDISDLIGEDKGKFKLTLFKKLAKESGLKIEQGRTKKEEIGVYYIYFTDGFVKYIKPAVYNNPNNKNHCINVYCGEKGDTKQGYWWDNELDYNDLIKFILTLEKESSKKVLKEDNKELPNGVVKFKLTDFKNACIRNNLNVDKSETPIYDKKYLIYFIKRYITYITVPVYINTLSKNENKIKIKTLKEDSYYTWVGALDYADLIEKLLEIEKKGQTLLKEDIKEVKEKIETLKTQQDEQVKMANKLKEEYEKIKLKESQERRNMIKVGGIETTKDLRDRLLKYAQFCRNRLSNPPKMINVETILLHNIENLEAGSIIVNRDVIPEKRLKGNSKAWTKKDNMLILQNRLDNRKLVEGLIEGFIDIKIEQRNYNKVQKQMFKEALTYMFCKMIGLDVRTYCNSPTFEHLLKMGDTNISNYLAKTFNLFDGLLKYFV